MRLVKEAVLIAAAASLIFLSACGGGTYKDSYAGVMVYVKGGTFVMGCAQKQVNECDDFEKPAHDVTLGDFYIGKYEVTQTQWKAIMGTDNNPSTFRGDRLPVENVSWYSVGEFIDRLNEVTQGKYRLPTEAEWEYAARGGGTSREYKYSGSENIGSVAWYGGNSGGVTHAVGKKRANSLGIFDMSGNVWEWVSDLHGRYHAESQTNPTGAASGLERVNRGGGWSLPEEYSRVSYRHSNDSDNSSNSLGFRLAHGPRQENNAETIKKDF